MVERGQMLKKDETWKSIVGFKGIYEVSSRGRVRSLYRKVPQRNRWGNIHFKTIKESILSQRIEKNGYKRIMLYSGDMTNGASFSVHRLVALSFVDGESVERNEVNHIDCNKSNNDFKNLEWVTTRENISHAIKNGLMINNRGERSHYSKISKDVVMEIAKELIVGNQSNNAISKRFNLSRSAIDRINNGKAWFDLTSSFIKKYPIRDKRCVNQYVKR